MTNKNGIQTNVGVAEERAIEEMKKSPDIEEMEVNEIWEQSFTAAGVRTEQGIPVQGFRHLMATWGGVKAAVILATRLKLKGKNAEIAEFKLEAKKQRERADSLQAKLDVKVENYHIQEIDNVKHRVAQVLVQNKVSESVQALVCEEIES